MAKLPSTIYRELNDLQKELYDEGITNGSLALGDVYDVFQKAGYKRTTANKWLLNWAVCCILSFEMDNKKGVYRVRLGDYTNSKTPKECLDDNKVWLPVKEVKIIDDLARASQCLL